MTSYRRLTESPVPTSGAAVCTESVLPGDYVYRIRAKRLKKEALVEWESEGGSIAEPAGAPRSR
jgi:hypothetical protein